VASRMSKGKVKLAWEGLWFTPARLARTLCAFKKFALWTFIASTFTGFPFQRLLSHPTTLQMATASTMSSWSRASTVTAIGVGAVVTGVVGYVIYFDHRRRTDPQFRKALKRESRKQEKAAKQEAEAASSRQRKAIREAVEKVNQDDLPTDPEEVEKFFMDEVAEGEILCQNRELHLLELLGFQ
jgi:hypothetical protein